MSYPLRSDSKKPLRVFWGLLELGVAGWAALIFGSVAAPLLSSEMMSGWDLTPQYLLFERFLDNISRGQLSGYDPSWYAGYPEFTFYGPGVYLVISALYWLGFGALTPTSALNFFVFCCPPLFLIAARFSAGAWFGKRAQSVALIVATLYLMAPDDAFFYPSSIWGSLLHGHLAAFFATILSFFLLGTLGKSRALSILGASLWIGVLYAAIIVTHSITAIGTLFVVVLVLAFEGKRGWGQAIGGLTLAGILSAFYWVPFLEHFAFTSAEPLSVSQNDPLLRFLPGLDVVTQCSFGSWLEILVGFPTEGFVLLAGLAAGVGSLTRPGSKALPLCFLLLVLVLPRSIGGELFPSIPVHYGRFILTLIPLAVLVVVLGYLTLLRNRGAKVFSVVVLAWVFGVQILHSSLPGFVDSFMERPSSELVGLRGLVIKRREACQKWRDYPPVIPIAQTFRHQEALAMADFIATQHIDGRVAVESIPTGVRQSGSPHLFSTLLPLNYRIPVVPGLLAESAYSTEFLNPMLAVESLALRWGRNALGERFRMRTDQLRADQVMRRLALFNVDLILSSSAKYRSFLSAARPLDAQGRGAELIHQEGRFALFRLPHTRTMTDSLGDYRPWLFVSENGITFRRFSELWFSEDSLLAHPVIHSARPFLDLPSREQDRIGGIIYSVAPGSRLPLAGVSKYLERDLPVIAITERCDRRASSDLHCLSLTNAVTALPRLAELMEDLNSVPHLKPVSSASHEDEKISFSSVHGVILNFSYFPRWQSTSSDQTVFQVTPSLMFVFGAGDTELVFR